MLLCYLQALQSIAEFRGLRQLVLADCSAVTTGGLEQLSGLQGLHSLALLRCPRVGDKGMTVLHSLTCLTYLALTGCTKVMLSPCLRNLPSAPASTLHTACLPACLLDHSTHCLPACLSVYCKMLPWPPSIVSASGPPSWFLRLCTSLAAKRLSGNAMNGRICSKQCGC